MRSPIDLLNNVRLTQCIAPILSMAGTDINGTAIDRLGYERVTFLADIGISLDTLSGSVMLEVSLEHCDDNSTWVACANADLSASVAGTATGTICKIDDAAEDPALHAATYIGNKRYVRPVVLKTGTHTLGIPVAVTGISHGAHVLPAV